MSRKEARRQAIEAESNSGDNDNGGVVKPFIFSPGIPDSGCFSLSVCLCLSVCLSVSYSGPG